MSYKVQKYTQKASRFEFCCIRVLYLIPWVIVGSISMMIMAMIIGIFNFLNFFSVLFLGKRVRAFYDFFVKTQVWLAKSSIYFAGASDERPALHPF